MTRAAQRGGGGGGEASEASTTRGAASAEPSTALRLHRARFVAWAPSAVVALAPRADGGLVAVARGAPRRTGPLTVRIIRPLMTARGRPAASCVRRRRPRVQRSSPACGAVRIGAGRGWCATGTMTCRRAATVAACASGAPGIHCGYQAHPTGRAAGASGVGLFDVSRVHVRPSNPTGSTRLAGGVCCAATGAASAPRG